MARPLRRNVQGGWYHVFGRGIERRAIFGSRRDREHLLELFAEMHERYGVLIHAYALMTNHYHAILQTPDGNLSAAMQWLHGSYSMWFNVKHERVGPLFQGRFGGIPVEDSLWAYDLSLYVHLNPLRLAALGLDKTGRVLEGKGYQTPTREQVTERLGKLRRYPWSSYRSYAGYESPPLWLTTAELLVRAHEEPARRKAQYRADVQERLTRGVEPSRIEQLRGRVAIGAAGFVTAVREAAGGSLDGISGRRALGYRVTLQEVADAVGEVCGMPWEEIVQSRGNPGLGLFFWVARRLTGRTLREIGEFAGGRREGAVNMAVRRFDLQREENSQLQARSTRVLAMFNVQP